MATHFSVLTSCLMSSIGNSGARASGPMGCLVPGCRGGRGLLGMSATMLYQCSGISFSVRIILRSMENGGLEVAHESLMHWALVNWSIGIGHSHTVIPDPPMTNQPMTTDQLAL